MVIDIQLLCYQVVIMLSLHAMGVAMHFEKRRTLKKNSKCAKFGTKSKKIQSALILGQTQRKSALRVYINITSDVDL